MPIQKSQTRVFLGERPPPRQNRMTEVHIEPRGQRFDARYRAAGVEGPNAARRAPAPAAPPVRTGDVTFGRVAPSDEPSVEFEPRQLPQPEPFDHRRTHDLLDAPDKQLGGYEDVEKAEGHKLWPILKNQAQSVDAFEILITLGLEFDDRDLPDGVVDRRLDIIAHVMWGQGDGKAEAEVDWRNGVQISVPPSNVEIWAEFLEPEAEGTFKRAKVSAFYTHGSAANRSFPTRTIPSVVVAPSGSAVVKVPPFASGVVVLHDTVADGAVLSLTQLGGPLASDRVYGVSTPATVDASPLSEGIRLAGGTRFVLLKNADEVTPVTATLVFLLNL